MKIYLASNSPRRADLLRQIAVTFEVLTPEVDETTLTDEAPVPYVSRMALEKARQGGLMVQATDRARAPVLGADTAVIVDDCILGKPVDRMQARQMLRTLSGRRHTVLTAIALMHFPRGRDMEQFGAPMVVATAVTLDPLSEQEIDGYVATGESDGKAGGYAIQGYAGRYVARLEGSYTGVVGLPVREVARMLALLGPAYE